MLYDGAMLLLRHDQVDFCDLNMTLYVSFICFCTYSFMLFLRLQQTSGADLAILLVDVLVKAEISTSEDQFNKLSR